MLLGSLGSFLVLPVVLYFFHTSFDFQPKSMDHNYAVLGGIAASVGALFFYFAISKGDASKVVCITAMYPVVTVLLSFLVLKEPMNLAKTTGIIFALIGIFLLSK